MDGSLKKAFQAYGGNYMHHTITYWTNVLNFLKAFFFFLSSGCLVLPLGNWHCSFVKTTQVVLAAQALYHATSLNE